MGEKPDNWLGAWLSAAKNKSTEVLEFVKKDLEELGSAVKSEASSVMSSTGAVLEKTLSLDSPDSTASNMKRSFSSFLGQMNSVLNPGTDDSDTEILIVENSETVQMTKLQRAIYELQKNVDTYLLDPEENLQKQFQCWLEIIDDQLSDDRVAKHVNSSEMLKQQYAKLVPAVVEHQLFWKRYLFKKALLEDEIARQEMLNKREHKEKLMTDHLQWEKEDFATDIVLTEEEQIKLLEQYENERKNQKPSPKSKKIFGETVLFKQSSPEKINNNTDQNSKVKESPKSVNPTDSSASFDAPSSGSSTDGDWEKIGDVDK